MARQSYTDEFRGAAAELVREQGYSVKAAVEGLGVGPSLAAPSLEATADKLHRDNARLREKNLRLTMEREILNKATTFFAWEQP